MPAHLGQYLGLLLVRLTASHAGDGIQGPPQPVGVTDHHLPSTQLTQKRDGDQYRRWLGRILLFAHVLIPFVDSTGATIKAQLCRHDNAKHEFHKDYSCITNVRLWFYVVKCTL